MNSKMECSRFKFRVWDNENNNYLQECALLNSKTGNIAGHFPDNQFTIEQCTGLCDKNGMLIYEGSVLGFYIKTRPVYVQWDSDKCRFVLRRFDIEGWEISLIQDTASRYTIIGNIHAMESEND